MMVGTSPYCASHSCAILMIPRSIKESYLSYNVQVELTNAVCARTLYSYSPILMDFEMYGILRGTRS